MLQWLIMAFPPQYESQDYQRRVKESRAQHPRSTSQFAPMSLAAHHPTSQVIFNTQLGYPQPQQFPSRPSERPSQSSLGTQLGQGGHFAPPATAPYMAAPSFQTPQGTFYFIPNVVAGSAAPPSAGIPLASALPAPKPLPMPMPQARSESATSWDADVEALKPAVKKGKKGKNTTKRFVSPPSAPPSLSLTFAPRRSALMRIADVLSLVTSTWRRTSSRISAFVIVSFYALALHLGADR